MSSRKRLAWFTNSPKSKSTITEDYTARMLPVLKSYFEIEVYVDDFSEYPGFISRNYLKAASVHQESPYDLFVYQLENHPALNFARIHAGLQPGMTIFHHYNFTSFGPEPILSSPWQPTVSKYVDNEIPWYNRKDELDQIGPMAYRESAWTLLPVFTNPLNASDYRSNIDLSIANKHEIAPVYLPFPVAIPESSLQVENQKLAFLSAPDISHRIDSILWALKQNSDWTAIWLIDPEEQDLAKDLLLDYDLTDRVEVRIGRNSITWKEALAESSLAAHLLFSAYEQPCPYLAESLAAGKAVIMSDYGYSNSLPDSIVFKIPVGTAEKGIFAALLQELSVDQLQKIGILAKDFAQEHYSVDIVKQEFVNLIEDNAIKIKEFNDTWKKFKQAAREDVLSEIKSLYNQRFARQKEFSADMWQNYLGNVL